MSEPPVLDPQAIATIRSICPEDGGNFLCQLIDLFLTDTPKRLVEMESALARNSGGELGRAAHFVKGSAANFGANRVVALCFELEQLGKADSLVSAGEKLTELRAEFDRTRVALEALRAGT